MKRKSAIIIAILIMCVGFAAISTTLIINGSTKVSENTQDSDIYFSKARLDTVDVYESVISEDKKTISFSTNELKVLNQTSILTYEVTNNSNNYDAEVSLTCTPTSGKYTSITNEFDAKNNIVEARNTAKGRVTIKLNKVTTEETNEEYTCTLSFTAVERNVVGVEKEYKESLLNGTDPVLTENLIPVTIADDGAVKYADVKKEWYSYEDKIWANAVILEDGASYNVGDTIQESDIQSYFVWIPRYRYKLFNVDNYSLTTVASAEEVENKAQEIEIEFENKDTATSNGSNNGEWLTHPAFTSFDANGMWVGKFETGYKGATSKTAAQVNSNDISKVIIKPNVYSWRNINVKNIFETSYNYQRDNDSHMMKNTEWGAVAYLSHSKYGIRLKIRVNNNLNFVTGYSAIEEPALGHSSTSINGNQFESVNPGEDGNYTVNYFNFLSSKSSTTGNKSGIYDMSGGSWDSIMAYTTKSSTVGGNSGIISDYSDFFDSEKYKIYWDKYDSKSDDQYSNRILGDATGETGPFKNERDPDNSLRKKSSWYKERAYFISSTNAWFIRGGESVDGTESGIFAFNHSLGSQYSNVSFRIVLTP